MNFSQAVRSALIDNYSTFKGRACRAEWWYFVLFTIIFSIFISGIGSGSVYLLTISYLQSTTEKKLRGRVFGNFYTIGRLSILISLLISGFVANFANQYLEVDGVLLVLRISACFILLSGLITFLRGYKQIFQDFGFENSNFNKLTLNLNREEDEPL